MKECLLKMKDNLENIKNAGEPSHVTGKQHIHITQIQNVSGIIRIHLFACIPSKPK